MVATKTSIEIEDLPELKIFCIRHGLNLKQFVNRAIVNEKERMGEVPKNRGIVTDIGTDAVTFVAPDTLLDPDTVVTEADGSEISSVPPSAEGGVETFPDTDNSPEPPEPKISKKDFAPKNEDTPKGFWTCSHCRALNETDNKTGICSSCGKKAE